MNMGGVGSHPDALTEVQSVASEVETLNQLINSVAQQGPWTDEEVMIAVRRAEAAGKIDIVGEAGTARVIDQ